MKLPVIIYFLFIAESFLNYSKFKYAYYPGQGTMQRGENIRRVQNILGLKQNRISDTSRVCYTVPTWHQNLILLADISSTIH